MPADRAFDVFRDVFERGKSLGILPRTARAKSTDEIEIGLVLDARRFRFRDEGLQVLGTRMFEGPRKAQIGGPVRWRHRQDAAIRSFGLVEGEEADVVVAE